jgi:DNA-binding winged helix-turn-helix (wHTH) protein/tetratricopeptide (TPR) repeat protein
MAFTVKADKRARFSSYEFDPRTGDLLRSGIRIRLETQPAKVLALLIEAEGDLVARREMISELWPGEVHGNFDRRLDKAVAKLRASLNDDPAKPRYIETLKGRGYRFLAAVVFDSPVPAEEATARSAPNQPQTLLPPAPPDNPGVASEHQSSKRRGIFRRLPNDRKLAAFAGLAVVVSAITWEAVERPGPPAQNRPVVLILGFRDLSGTPANEWVLHSLADWLSTDLKAGGDVQVLVAGDSPVLQPVSGDGGCGELPANALKATGQAFGADQIVYGNYSETENSAAGERVRLDLCLRDLHSRQDAQAVTIIGAKGDIGQLVINASDLLRARLGLKRLSGESAGYIRATLPANQAAARLYAKGTSALAHFEPEEASVLLTEAAQIEPQHAATHAALSAAWAALGYEERSREEAVRARDLAKELSPIQRLTYEGLAEEASNDWPAAISTYSRLFQLYPDSLDFGLKLAEAQTHANKASDGLATIRALAGSNPAAQTDPRVDLTEARADAAASDFRGQLSASIRAEKHAAAQGSALLIADARMEQGDAEDMLDNWDDAQRLWRLAGQRYESIGDYGGVATALNHEGLMAWHRADPANAIKLFQEALALSKRIGDRSGIAFSVSRLGDVQLYEGKGFTKNEPGAIKLFKEAAAIYHEAGNTAEEGYVLSLLGDDAIGRSSYEEAKEFYLKSMALSQAANDRSRIANRLLDLGIVAEFEGNSQEAERYFRQSAAACEELGELDRAAIAKERLGKALFREGKIDEAASMLSDSLASMRSIGRIFQLIGARSDLIYLELERNPQRAEELARENIADSKRNQPGTYLGDPYSLALLAEAEAKQGKLQDARQSIALAFKQAEDSAHGDFAAPLLLARGYVRMSDHDLAAASADFQRSQSMTHHQGRVYEELEARLGLAEIHIVLRRDAAQEELRRVRQDAERLGYGIFSMRLESFLHAAGDAQQIEISDAQHRTAGGFAR